MATETKIIEIKAIETLYDKILGENGKITYQGNRPDSDFQTAGEWDAVQQGPASKRNTQIDFDACRQKAMEAVRYRFEKESGYGEKQIGEPIDNPEESKLQPEIRKIAERLGIIRGDNTFDLSKLESAYQDKHEGRSGGTAEVRL